MIQFQFAGIQGVIDNLLKFEREQHERLRLACEEVAQLLERYAITHHIWTVRTGGTNVTTLGTWDELPGDLYQVVLSAGMDYDVWLEGKTVSGGDRDPKYQKFKWIWPAITANKTEIMNTFARHLRH